MYRVLLPIFLIIFTGCASNKKLSIKERKAKIYYSQGTTELYNGKYTKALKYLLQAQELEPENSKVHNNLGMAYYFKQNESLAIKHLNESIKLDPKNTDARMNIATIYLNQKRYDMAEKLYKEILNDLVYEQQQKTHYNLATIYRKTGLKEKATFHLKKAIEVDETFCPAHFELGQVYSTNGSFDEAYKSFYKSSLGVCFKSPEPHWEQAKALIQLERYADANEKLEFILGRFDTTKYASMARRKILAITPLVKNDIKSEFSLKSRIKKNLSTSDF